MVGQVRVLLILLGDVLGSLFVFEEFVGDVDGVDREGGYCMVFLVGFSIVWSCFGGWFDVLFFVMCFFDGWKMF